eukprot:jgi/Sobl393_1/8963/SZX79373.1
MANPSHQAPAEAHGSATETTTEVSLSLNDQEGPGAMYSNFVTKTDDYMYRPEELEDMSPILFTMTYYKKSKDLQRLDEEPKGGLEFLDGHPQQHTHVLRRRARPVLPRFISDPPLRPAAGATADAHEQWAAWCMANFTAYRANSIPTPPFYNKVVQWEADLGISMPTYDTSCAQPSDAAHSAPASSDLGATPMEQDINLGQLKLEDFWGLPGADELAAAHLPAMVSLKTMPSVPPPDVSVQAAPVAQSLDLIAHRILVNSNSRAVARWQCKENCQLRRQAHAMAKEIGAKIGGCDHDTGNGEYDDGDDFEWECDLRNFTGVSDSLLNDPSYNQHWFQQELEVLKSSKTFTSAALGALQCPALDDLPHTNPHSSEVVVNSTASARASLYAIRNPAHAVAQFQQQHNHNNIQETMTLRSTEDAHGMQQLQAVVKIVNLDPNSPHGDEPQFRITPVGGAPEFIKLNHPIYITEVIQLFTLNKQQALAFATLATKLDNKLDNVASPQLLMLLLGDPGTGKSQVIKAFEWYAFQKGASDRVAVTSYTWRAALHVSNDVFPASSTSTYYGINSMHGNKLQKSPAIQQRRRDQLTEVWLALNDEVSFVDQSHFNAIDKAYHTALPFNAAPFAGVDQVHIGDPQQLPPVAGRPMFMACQEPAPTNQESREAKEYNGRKLWEKFDTVIMLTEQNRISETDADGQQLLQYVKVFCNVERDPDRDELKEVIKAIDAAAVSEAELNAMLPLEPKAVVFRNDVRMMVSRALCIKTATVQGKRLVMWHSIDTTEHGVPLPKGLQAPVNLINPKKTKDMNGWSMFYEGIPYVFIDNTCTPAGRIKNNSCIGQALLLDMNEPPEDNPPQKVRWLKYPPQAVFVRPALVEVGDACSRVCAACPSGCIAVALAQKTFGVTLPEPVTLRSGKVKQSFTVVRSNIPLGDGFAFTDFFCQGMSFKDQPWLADMRPPPTGTLDRASLAVVLSRFASWSRFKGLTPLWPRKTTCMTKEAKAARKILKNKTIDYYWQMAKMHPELRAELQRLRALAAKTEQHLLNLYGHLLPSALQAQP